MNNLIPRNSQVYKRIEMAFRNDATEYDYVGFRAKVRKVVDEIGGVSEEERNAVMLAVELEDSRRNPIAFKYILDDCIREEGRSEDYKRAARQLVERLDVLYGGMPSDIEDGPIGKRAEASNAEVENSSRLAKKSDKKSKGRRGSGRKAKGLVADQPSLFDNK